MTTRAPTIPLPRALSGASRERSEPGSDSAAREEAVRDVEESRTELGRALGDLEGVVRNGLDPARWIAERPLPWLLAGLALGLWLGTRR